MKNSDRPNVLIDIITIIEQTKTQFVIQANSALTLMYWHIGERINSEVLHHDRAEYGKKILVTLSRELTNKFGNNFNEKNS